MAQQTDYIRQQLVKHIKGGTAFMPIEEMLKDIPFQKLGVVPEHLPYSFWQQFYHLRFAQYDILDFSRNPDYESAQWPKDYWPENEAPENEAEWKALVNRFFSERQEFIDLLLDPANDLYVPFPHGNGQTLYREAILIIEHNAYHTGQLLIILRLLGLH